MDNLSSLDKDNVTVTGTGDNIVNMGLKDGEEEEDIPEPITNITKPQPLDFPFNKFELEHNGFKIGLQSSQIPTTELMQEASNFIIWYKNNILNGNQKEKMMWVT